MSNIANLKPLSKIALVRQTKLKIKPLLKSLLLILTTHLGKNSFCFPSIDTLMIEMEIGGRRHLIKYLNELEKLGLIKRSKKDKRANKYWVNLELIFNINKGMVPPWEPVPTRELNQFPLDENQFPSEHYQFPQGNSKALKALNENKGESFITPEQAKEEIRRICKFKKK